MGWSYLWISAYRRWGGAWHGVKRWLYPADRHMVNRAKLAARIAFES